MLFMFLKRTVSLKLIEYPQHMFLVRYMKMIVFKLHTFMIYLWAWIYNCINQMNRFSHIGVKELLLIC